MTDGPEAYREIDQRRMAGLIIVIVVVISLFVFWLQNRESIEVEFLFISVRLPIWLIIAISMVLGAILLKAVGFLRSRRKTE